MITMKLEQEVPYDGSYHEWSTDNVVTTSDEVKDCLSDLEEWVAVLLNAKEAVWNVSKLTSCYWCVNAIRNCFKSLEVEKQLILCGNLKKLSSYLKKIILKGSYAKSAFDIGCFHTRSPLAVLRDKGYSNKRKMKHKFGINKQSRDLKCLKEHLPRLVQQDNADLQYFIDQLYIQTRNIITEHSLNEALLSKDFDSFIYKSLLARSNALPRMTPLKYPPKYEPPWSGDCKIDGDSQENFLDSFDKILESSNYDLDLEDFTTDLLPRCKASNVGSRRSRLKRESDFDEGFSENESLDDSRSNSRLSAKGSGPAVSGSLRYDGDSNYNSSNSKLYGSLSPESVDVVDNEQLMDDSQMGEESDSDGGTDLLNCVNATVNKFNDFMESKWVPTHTCEDGPIGNEWTTTYRNPPACFRNEHTPEAVGTVVPKFAALPPIHTRTHLSLDRRLKSPSTNSPLYISSTPDHCQPLPSVPYVNYESLPKTMVSQMDAPNWFPFNSNYAPSRSCNYYPKSLKNCDLANPSAENYDVQGPQRWPSCLAGSLPTSSSYTMSQNQPQVHRILFSPHRILPSISLDHGQHGLLHLPQVFQPHHQAPFDTEYFGRRYGRIEGNSVPGPPRGPCQSDCVSQANNHSNAAPAKANPSSEAFKASLDKSQRACCFYMRGGCKKEDCEYAHDLSKVTCKFWEKGDCFKAATCPFKHSYRQN